MIIPILWKDRAQKNYDDSRKPQEVIEKEAIRRMTALNIEIAVVEELNENYQIGASYFLKLRTLSFEQLWTDYLQPLLQDYIRGMYDEEGIMKKFAKAYSYVITNAGDADKTVGQLEKEGVFVLPRYLKEAMRKGIFKTYIRSQYNDR